jgi:hypothetical protein
VDSLWLQTEYVSFVSQNDLYQPALKADKDFTNGLSVVYGGSFIRKTGGQFIGIAMSESFNEYSLGLVQEMFTPEDIRNPELDTTDRPYSGLLHLDLTAISNRLRKGQRLVSRLSLGIQGPASLAKETQSWVHGFTNNYVPAGWDNQIGNGLLLDYEIRYQHLVSPSATYLESSVQVIAHAGTMRNFLQAGILNRIGWFNSSFINFGGLRNRNTKTDQIIKVETGKGRHRRVFVNRKWQAYLIADADISYVLYDGTVSGSLVPFESSLYTLEWDQITRFSGATRLGIDLSYGAVQLQYAWRVTGYRVQGSDLTGWGQFRLVVSL